ncbi:hypothetical protein EJB05_16664 [Eragrostis curvula]|uniref:Uncharacterized protein n=1 Tax=Eragrostis curvula TaxID=38414 RepID=A0A5J9VER7_9POAL|nr:hypothetical protein EJB05_16664 [Eragrostis curvula]
MASSSRPHHTCLPLPGPRLRRSVPPHLFSSQRSPRPPSPGRRRKSTNDLKINFAAANQLRPSKSAPAKRQGRKRQLWQSLNATHAE